MPKIIEKGNKQAEPFRGTCKTCGSLIEFEQQELTGLQHDRDGSMSLENCPVCQSDFWVYPHKN